MRNRSRSTVIRIEYFSKIFNHIEFRLVVDLLLLLIASLSEDPSSRCVVYRVGRQQQKKSQKIFTQQIVLISVYRKAKKKLTETHKTAAELIGGHLHRVASMTVPNLLMLWASSCVLMGYQWLDEVKKCGESCLLQDYANENDKGLILGQWTAKKVIFLVFFHITTLLELNFQFFLDRKVSNQAMKCQNCVHTNSFEGNFRKLTWNSTICMYEAQLWPGFQMAWLVSLPTSQNLSFFVKICIANERKIHSRGKTRIWCT